MLVGGAVSSVVGIDSRAIPDASVWVWPQWAQQRFVTDITDYPYPPLFLFNSGEVQSFLSGQAKQYAMLPCFATLPVEVSASNLTAASVDGMGCIGWPETSPGTAMNDLQLGLGKIVKRFERAKGRAEILDESWWADSAADAAPLVRAPTRTIEWTIENPTEALPPAFRSKTLGLTFAQRMVRAEITLPIRTWDESTPDSVALGPRLGCLEWRVRTVLDASSRGFVAVSSEAHLMGPCPGAARPQGYQGNGGVTSGQGESGESGVGAARAGLGWVLLDAATYGAHTGRAAVVAVLLGSAVLTSVLGAWGLVQGVVVMLNIVLLEAEAGDDLGEEGASLDERESGGSVGGLEGLKHLGLAAGSYASGGSDGSGGGDRRRRRGSGSDRSDGVGAESSAFRLLGTAAVERPLVGGAYGALGVRRRGRASSLTQDQRTAGGGGGGGGSQDEGAVGPLPVFSRPRALSAGSSATFSVAASSVVGPLDPNDLDRLGGGGHRPGGLRGWGAPGPVGRSPPARPSAVMRRMPRGVLRRLRTQSRIALTVGPGSPSISGDLAEARARSGEAVGGLGGADAFSPQRAASQRQAQLAWPLLPMGSPPVAASRAPAGVLHAATAGTSALGSPGGGLGLIREASVASSINAGEDGAASEADLASAYRPLGEGAGAVGGMTGGRRVPFDVRSDIAAGLVEDPATKQAQEMHLRVNQLQAIWQQTSAWDRFQMLRPWLLIATAGAVVVSVWTTAAMLQGLAVAVDQHAHRSHEHGAWATATVVTGSAGHLRWVLSLGTFLLCLGLVHYTEPYPLWFAVSGTIARAWGRILELFAGAGPIFMAYTLLGVAIFGRYSLRFGSSNRSALTLFAFMNGDAMRETFDHVSTLVIGVPEALQQRTDMNHWGFLLGPLHDQQGLEPVGPPVTDDHFRDDDVGPSDADDTDDFNIDLYGLDSIQAARHWLPGFLALYMVSFEFFLLYVALNSLVAIAEESFFATRPEGDSALAPTVGGEEGVATVGGRRLPAMLRALLLQVSRDSGRQD